MAKRAMGWLLLVGALLALGRAAPSFGEVGCGQKVVSSLTLTRDLRCPGHGLIIAKDSVVVDLGGHTLTGPGRGRWTWPDPGLSSVGIWAAGRRGIVVRNGRVQGFATALLLQRSEGVKVERIATTGSLFGIYLDRSRRVEVVESLATENIYGIHLKGSHENLIQRGSASRNRYNSPGGYGLYLIGSEGNVIRENLVEANANWGLWLSDSRRNRIYHNTIVDNHPNALDSTGENLWYHEGLQEGNYWGDYRGRDADGDGIGDSPYAMEGQGRDPYPLMRREGRRR